MTRPAALLFATAIGASLVALHAQTPRDPASAATAAQASPVSGTAVVSGVVLSNDSPAKPLRRVTVSLVASDFRVPFSTVSGDDGQWTMTGVPAGYYSVVASKPSFLGAFFGSTRPGRGPGVPVRVVSNARVSGVSLTLARGGVIAGVMRLPSGQPANNMPVVVVEVETVAGVRRLRLTGGRTSTNDRGEFRIFGLPPGDYLVQGQPSGLLTGALTNTNDAPQTTSADVSWAMQMAQRGRAGSPAAPAAPPAKGKAVNYATVYFPGTTDPSSAAIVTIGLGEERGGIDFALALVATAKVSGVVAGPDGVPVANVQIGLSAPEGGMNVRGLVAPRTSVVSGADGSFAVLAVPPGRYQLSARTTNGDFWAVQAIAVDGQDVTGVALGMQPALTVRGTIAFDSTPTPSGSDLAKARVTLAPDAGNGAADALASIASSATASVATDGSFVVSGLAPLAYRITITMPGIRANPTAPAGGWTLRSITVGTVDVSDRALDLRARQSVDGLVATFTDRPTTLVGALTDQANQPASGYPIVVFSTTKSEWTMPSRRIAVARPSTDGSFRLIGLPAGTYYLCAVVNLDPSDLEDPVFLEQLARTSITITLADGATVTQNLKIAGR